MSRYTVNLSRARMASTNRRAKKAMSILRSELEKREGVEVSISGDINSKIWERGASNPPSSLEVEIVEGSGKKRAVLTGTSEETALEETQEEDETESEEDYSNLVAGTVSEAKENIEAVEDPDYEALLEAEESGKDRKTLKEFIEGKM